jgi:RNA polymerase sigma-70 factor (ECF subfamily)
MIDDFELIQQAQRGNRLAFRDLVKRHQKTAFYFAYSLTGNFTDAEDLSQDAFIQIYRSLDRFRGDSKFTTWLYRITFNTWSNMKRQKNSKIRSLVDSMDDDHVFVNSEAHSSPEHETDKTLLYEHIQHATKRLSPQEKSVFVMRQFQDLKLDDIADIMNIKIGTVKSLLFRALKKMQKELAFYQQECER